MAQLLDGKTLAQKIQEGLKNRIATLQGEGKRSPGLAVIMVGDNPASAAYVRNKERACTKIGMVSFGQHLPSNISQGELIDLIHQFNRDDRIDGILVQLPLPPHLDAVTILHQIDPDKDADGLHPVNLGRLLRGESGLRSCTPAGVMRLLAEYNLDVAGQQALVLGRSILVGKPLGLMLLEANATVTIAHSRTVNLANLTRQADLLIAAIGKPQFVKGIDLKPGAIVIDVGINRLEDSTGKGYLVGDVDFEEAEKVAGFITPVPGGVGPMTVAMLLENTMTSYTHREIDLGGTG